MSVNFENIDKSTAKERIKDLRFAVVQSLSEYKMGMARDLIDFDEKECVEARFFSEEEEVRFFRKGDSLESVRSTDDGSCCLDEELVIADRFKAVGNEAVVRNYLEEDEDGQVYVAATRLCDIREE